MDWATRQTINISVVIRCTVEKNSTTRTKYLIMGEERLWSFATQRKQQNARSSCFPVGNTIPMAQQDDLQKSRCVKPSFNEDHNCIFRLVHHLAIACSNHLTAALAVNLASTMLGVIRRMKQMIRRLQLFMAGACRLVRKFCFTFFWD